MSGTSNPAAALLLTELGAAVPNARLWCHIAGMAREKDIIERKLTLPLATTDVGVVNELLKALVGFRQQSGRLFICATNSVRTLDPAFLQHGRFDYVLPVGPPDPPARQALWRNYIANGEPDLDAITEASDGLTPADIRHAAHRVAQQTFERAVETGMSQDPHDGTA